MTYKPLAIVVLIYLLSALILSRVKQFKTQDASGKNKVDWEKVFIWSLIPTVVAGLVLMYMTKSNKKMFKAIYAPFSAKY